MQNIEEMEEMALERREAWVPNPVIEPAQDPLKVNEQTTMPASPLTNRPPTSMLFHQDGLSDTQFQKCMAHEFQGTKNAFRALANRYELFDSQPKLTCVVVGKCHHTRFYPTYESQSHGAGRERTIDGNAKPSLLVRDVVSTLRVYNFY
jgi:hypothetical protein